MNGSESSRGLRLRAWRALRFDRGRVPDLSRVTAPPYDSVEPQELRGYVARDPHNVVRLTIPELGAAAGQGAEGAGDLLSRWKDTGIIRTDHVPALYVYEYTDEQTTVRGVVGLVDVTDQAPVLPHEGVMAHAVDDRAALLESADADLEPLVLVPAHSSGLSSALDSWTFAPEGEFHGEDGGTHRWWRLDGEAAEQVAASVADTAALLADGHHRLAAHRRLSAAARRAGDEATAARWDHALAIVIDQHRHPLRVEPVHRVVPGIDLRGADVPPGWRRHVASPIDPVGADEIRVTVDGEHVSWRREVRDARSSVELLHDELFPSWGVGEAWTPVLSDARLARDRAVATSGSAVMLSATPLHRVLSQASSGIAMPAKSTAFAPKPRTGLFMRHLADERCPVTPPSRGSTVHTH